MKILFCGGGTFGHVAPAIAVAKMFSTRDPNANLIFVGRAGGKENEAIRKHGYPLLEIPMKSIGRAGVKENAQALILLAKSFSHAKQILEKEKPDLVFGTGGYVCFPLMRTAQRMHIKTVLHESNAVPGRACRMLAKRCDAVLLGIRDAEDGLPKGTRCRFTGNPVREGFFRYTREDARRILGIGHNERLLLSFGGSGGAEVLNGIAMRLMKSLAEHGDGIYHIHACGAKYFDKIKKEYPSFTTGKGRFRVYPYIDNMPLYMCGADLCICRSGAMTVAELAAAKLPSILIPSPNVKDNHQYKNARSPSDKGDRKSVV